MRMCDFPGCEHLHGHGPSIPHGKRRAFTARQVPSSEERVSAQVEADNREQLRHARAESIARNAMNDRAWIADDRLTFRQALHVATAAALQALTETENAR